MAGTGQGGGGGWMPNLGLGTTLTQVYNILLASNISILLSTTSFQLGRAAKDISSTLENGLQNVAENLEGAFVTLGEGTAERAGYDASPGCFTHYPMSKFYNSLIINPLSL